jgi:hypothetical protein
MIKRLLIICAFWGVGMGLYAKSDVCKGSDGTAYGQLECDNVSEDSNGPTIFLDCSKDPAKRNPIPAFMYFVPLISPVSVDSEASLDSQQRGGLISCKRKSDSKSFYVSCEFQMQGKGSHKNTFDSAEMIKRNTRDLKEGEPLRNILGYIKFEGEGYGRIDVTGKIVGSTEIVTKTNVYFNNRWPKSPVTIGLYSVKPVDGEYKYENRYNEIIARVNTLTFKRSEEIPKMGIRIASLRSAEGSDGIWGSIKGAIANLFIKPLEVDKVGNDAMLDLGYALLKKNLLLPFPRRKI